MNRNAPRIALAFSSAAVLVVVQVCEGCNDGDLPTTGATTTAMTVPTTSGGVCVPGEWLLCGSGGSGGAGGAGNSGEQDSLPGCGAPPNRCHGVQVCEISGDWSGCQAVVAPSPDACDPFDCDGINAPERASCLVADALVRYYIDEAAEGIPTALQNSAPGTFGNYDLVIADAPPVFNAHFYYFQQLGQRGVRWSDNGQSTRAVVFLGGQQIPPSLDQLTIEIVLDIDEVLPNTGSVAMYIGELGMNGDLLLGLGASDGTSTQPQVVSLFWSNASQPVARWSVSTGIRRVLHIVVDPVANEDPSKVVLYADGIRIESTSVTPPNGPLALGGSEYLILGNTFNGSRTFVGNLYYAALYASALPEETVRKHAEILRCDDDGLTAP